MVPVARHARARLRVHLPDDALVAIRAQRAPPQEPRQIRLQVLRAHALEPVQETVEVRVERVDPVDAMRLRVRLLEHGPQSIHRSGIGRSGIRHDACATFDATGERFDDALLGDDAASAQYGERRIGIVHAGHDANLLPAQAAPVQGAAATAGGTRQNELALPVVALEAFSQIRLIQLDGHARTGREPRQEPFGAFEQSAAHEPRGTQRHLAPDRAFTQRKAVHEALHVHHPLGDRQLRPADQRVPHLRERSLAILAHPTLGAVRIIALPDDGDGTAMRTGEYIIMRGDRVVGVLVQDFAQFAHRVLPLDRAHSLELSAHRVGKPHRHHLQYCNLSVTTVLDF